MMTPLSPGSQPGLATRHAGHQAPLKVVSLRPEGFPRTTRAALALTLGTTSGCHLPAQNLPWPVPSDPDRELGGSHPAPAPTHQTLTSFISLLQKQRYMLT